MDYDIPNICHDGIVESIGADKCRVRILETSACNGCEARKLCRSSESREKIIEVRRYPATLRVGDSVTLRGSVRQSLRASVLAYAIPLALMLTSLFIGVHIAGEGIGALAALAVLALYYGALRLLRDKLGRQFELKIDAAKAG